jgi:hypothetical protein
MCLGRVVASNNAVAWGQGEDACHGCCLVSPGPPTVSRPETVAGRRHFTLTEKRPRLGGDNQHQQSRRPFEILTDSLFSECPFKWQADSREEIRKELDRQR